MGLIKIPTVFFENAGTWKQCPTEPVRRSRCCRRLCAGSDDIQATADYPRFLCKYLLGIRKECFALEHKVNQNICINVCSFHLWYFSSTNTSKPRSSVGTCMGP